MPQILHQDEDRVHGQILEGPEIITNVNERMSQYLDDQSSIVGYFHVAQDQSTNEAHDRFHLSVFDNDLVAGCCALCPGVVDWHDCGTVLGLLECGLGLVWTLYSHFVH